MYAASDKGRLSILTGVRKHRNTPKGQATYKRYMQSDKGRLAFRQGARRRREKKLGLDPVLSNEEIASIYLRFGNQCFRCGAVENLALDHHRPLSRGYGLTFANAVLLCKSCNSQKHNKMPEEFYTQEELNRLEFL